MKKLFIGVILAFIGVCVSGCLCSIFDVQLPDSEEIVTVPSSGGSFCFDVIAGAETKTSFEDRLWSFEYRIIIDEVIIDQQIVNISLTNQHIHTGDVFKVAFTIPANESPEQRDILIKTLKARNSDFYQYHVDASDNDWQVIWRAVQLGR